MPSLSNNIFFKDLWLVICLVPYVLEFLSIFILLIQGELGIEYFLSRWPRIWGIINFLIALFLFLLVRVERRKKVTERNDVWKNRELYLAVFLCVGFILRLYAATMMHFGDTDEIVYVLHARDLHFGRGFVYVLLQRVWWKLWGFLFNPLPVSQALAESIPNQSLAALLFASRCLNVLLSSLSLILLYLIGRRLFDESTAVLAVILHSVNWSMITGTESHAYSENPGSFFLLLSLALLVYFINSRETDPRLPLFFSGVALASSFSCRFTLGIFVPLILLVILLFYRQTKNHSFLPFLLGFAMTMVIEGYAESLPTGILFGGSIHLIFFNIIEGKNVWWGVEPWYTYLQWIHRFMGFTLVFLPYAIRKTRAVYLLGLLILPYLAIFSIIPHKELRFVSCLFPFIYLLVANGLVNKGLRGTDIRLSITHTLAYGILMTILW